MKRVFILLLTFLFLTSQVYSEDPDYTEQWDPDHAEDWLTNSDNYADPDFESRFTEAMEGGKLSEGKVREIMQNSDQIIGAMGKESFVNMMETVTKTGNFGGVQIVSEILDAIEDNEVKRDFFSRSAGSDSINLNDYPEQFSDYVLVQHGFTLTMTQEGQTIGELTYDGETFANGDTKVNPTGAEVKGLITTVVGLIVVTDEIEATLENGDFSFEEDQTLNDAKTNSRIDLASFANSQNVKPKILSRDDGVLTITAPDGKILNFENQRGEETPIIRYSSVDGISEKGFVLDMSTKDENGQDVTRTYQINPRGSAKVELQENGQFSIYNTLPPAGSSFSRDDTTTLVRVYKQGTRTLEDNGLQQIMLTGVNGKFNRRYDEFSDSYYDQFENDKIEGIYYMSEREKDARIYTSGNEVQDTKVYLGPGSLSQEEFDQFSREVPTPVFGATLSGLQYAVGSETEIRYREQNVGNVLRISSDEDQVIGRSDSDSPKGQLDFTVQFPSDTTMTPQRFTLRNSDVFLKEEEGQLRKSVSVFNAQDPQATKRLLDQGLESTVTVSADVGNWQWVVDSDGAHRKAVKQDGEWVYRDGDDFFQITSEGNIRVSGSVSQESPDVKLFDQIELERVGFEAGEDTDGTPVIKKSVVLLGDSPIPSGLQMEVAFEGFTQADIDNLEENGKSVGYLNTGNTINVDAIVQTNENREITKLYINTLGKVLRNDGNLKLIDLGLTDLRDFRTFLFDFVPGQEPRYGIPTNGKVEVTFEGSLIIEEPSGKDLIKVEASSSKFGYDNERGFSLELTGKTSSIDLGVAEIGEGDLELYISEDSSGVFKVDGSLSTILTTQVSGAETQASAVVSIQSDRLLGGEFDVNVQGEIDDEEKEGSVSAELSLTATPEGGEAKDVSVIVRTKSKSETGTDVERVAEIQAERVTVTDQFPGTGIGMRVEDVSFSGDYFENDGKIENLEVVMYETENQNEYRLEKLTVQGADVVVQDLQEIERAQLAANDLRASGVVRFTGRGWELDIDKARATGNIDISVNAKGGLPAASISGEDISIGNSEFSSSGRVLIKDIIEEAGGEKLEIKVTNPDGETARIVMDGIGGENEIERGLTEDRSEFYIRASNFNLDEGKVTKVRDDGTERTIFEFEEIKDADFVQIKEITEINLESVQVMTIYDKQSNKLISYGGLRPAENQDPDFVFNRDTETLSFGTFEAEFASFGGDRFGGKGTMGEFLVQGGEVVLTSLFRDDNEGLRLKLNNMKAANIKFIDENGREVTIDQVELEEFDYDNDDGSVSLDRLAANGIRMVIPKDDNNPKSLEFVLETASISNLDLDLVEKKVQFSEVDLEEGVYKVGDDIAFSIDYLRRDLSETRTTVQLTEEGVDIRDLEASLKSGNNEGALDFDGELILDEGSPSGIGIDDLTFIGTFEGNKIKVEFDGDLDLVIPEDRREEFAEFSTTYKQLFGEDPKPALALLRDTIESSEGNAQIKVDLTQNDGDESDITEYDIRFEEGEFTTSTGIGFFDFFGLRVNLGTALYFLESYIEDDRAEARTEVVELFQADPEITQSRKMSDEAVDSYITGALGADPSTFNEDQRETIAYGCQTRILDACKPFRRG